MKFIGLLLIILCGTGIGMYAAAGLSRRATALELTQRLIARIGAQIRYTAAPMGEILCAAAEQEEFAPLLFLIQTGQAVKGEPDFHSAWRESLRRRGKESGLAPQDISLLFGFGEGLGTTDIEGQLSVCRMYSEQLTERLTTARKEAAGKNRLYTTLGMIGGVAVALLFL